MATLWTASSNHTKGQLRWAVQAKRAYPTLSRPYRFAPKVFLTHLPQVAEKLLRGQDPEALHCAHVQSTLYSSFCSVLGEPRRQRDAVSSSASSSELRDGSKATIPPIENERPPHVGSHHPSFPRSTHSGTAGPSLAMLIPKQQMLMTLPSIHKPHQQPPTHIMVKEATETTPEDESALHEFQETRSAYSSATTRAASPGGYSDQYLLAPPWGLQAMIGGTADAVPPKRVVGGLRKEGGRLPAEKRGRRVDSGYLHYALARLDGSDV